jgi:hypothetical protein
LLGGRFLSFTAVVRLGDVEATSGAEAIAREAEEFKQPKGWLMQ